MRHFTSNVRTYRQAQGLTQEELAGRVGARRETIVRLENSKYNPSLELAARIAHELGETIETLFRFDFQERAVVSFETEAERGGLGRVRT